MNKVKIIEKDKAYQLLESVFVEFNSCKCGKCKVPDNYPYRTYNYTWCCEKKKYVEDK